MSQKNIQEFFSKRAKLIDTPCTSAAVVSELGTSTTPNETSKLPTDKNTEDRASTSLVRERRIVSNNMDLGLYVSTFNKPELIGSVLSSPWTPDASYVFPSISPKNLRFQRSWFERFPWLVYSDVLEGALCKFCVLFGTTANRGLQNKQCLGKLVRQAHSNWKHAIDHYNKHQNNEYHKTSITMAENFVRINESEQSIDKQLDSHKRKIAKANRDKLVPVIESIVFCGRQGIALRGHRDDGQISIQQPIENDGNFRSLLRYRASYDGELLNQLNDGPANASYISKTIQNELINCIGVSIQQKIVKSVNSAKCFSILADETTDISAIEQLTICARYIGDDARMKEDFLCFVPLVKMDAESISTRIIEELRKLNLDLQYLRGQGYDGAR